VEAALAQLQGQAAQEEEMEQGVASTTAVDLLYYLLARGGPAAEECHRRVLAAGGVTPVVQHFVRSMAAGGGSSWQGVAAHLIMLLLLSSGKVDEARSSLCSWATAVEAGVVPVLLGCLARSRHPDVERVQSSGAKALGELAKALWRSNPGGRRQLPEPMRGALRPAVAALAGLLRSTQLSTVAAAALMALGSMALGIRHWPCRLPLRALRCWPRSGPAGRVCRRGWWRLRSGCWPAWH
jgi:hypothetical protein